MNVSVIVPALGTVAALILLTAAAGVQRAREARRVRREAAAARHPSRRQVLPRRRVPGRPVDGEPLSEKEMGEFIGIMMRSTTQDGKQV